MKRLALLLLFALPVQAGPVSWVKHQIVNHPVRTRIVTTIAAATVYGIGLHECRIPNVENCQEHYGAAWGGYGTTVGLNVVGQILGYKLHSHAGDAISYGGSTAMLGWGAYQWHGGLNKPAEDK